MPEFAAISPMQMPNWLKDLFESRLISPIIRDGTDLTNLFIQDTVQLVQQLPDLPIGTTKETRNLSDFQKLANTEYSVFQEQVIKGDFQFNLVLLVVQVTQTAIDNLQKSVHVVSDKTSQTILDQPEIPNYYTSKTAIIHATQQNEKTNSMAVFSFFKGKGWG